MIAFFFFSLCGDCVSWLRISSDDVMEKQENDEEMTGVLVLCRRKKKLAKSQLDFDFVEGFT